MRSISDKMLLRRLSLLSNANSMEQIEVPAFSGVSKDGSKVVFQVFTPGFLPLLASILHSSAHHA